jgi:hypothetical protein
VEEAPNERTRVKRYHWLAKYDRATVHSILDAMPKGGQHDFATAIVDPDRMAVEITMRDPKAVQTGDAIEKQRRQFDPALHREIVDDRRESRQALKIRELVEDLGIAQREFRVEANGLKQIVLIETRVVHADVTQDGALPLSDWSPFFLNQKIRLDTEVPEAKQARVVRVGRLVTCIFEVEAMLEFWIARRNEAVELGLPGLKQPPVTEEFLQGRQSGRRRQRLRRAELACRAGDRAELCAVRDANEVGELDGTIALHTVETARIGKRVRKDDHALHRRHRGELGQFRADERGQDLRVVADFVRRRGALILIAPVPEASAVFDAATEMFEVDRSVCPAPR